MAYPSDHRSSWPGTVRYVLVLAGLFLVVYMVTSPTLRHSKALSSCPPCFCDCEEDPMFSPLDILNSSLAECGKNDPLMNEEMKKDIATLLAEELSLHKNVTGDILQRTKALILSAKRASSHYQREAEKCNIGIDTCEGGREKAEAALIEERKLSALWETRAIEFGWKD